MIKSRRLRWTGRVSRMGRRTGADRFLVGKPEERNHLEDPGLDWRIILKWISEKWDQSGSGQGSVAGCCECGDEPSGSTK